MDISLIIPVYKAESFLAHTLQTIDADLAPDAHRWELILVIDASPDCSEAISRAFAATPRRYPVHIVVNDRNLGKGGAVRRGVLAARGNYRVFTDCDLAYPMSEVRKVVSALEATSDVVIASRAHKESRYTITLHDLHYLYTRHLASRAINWLVNHTIIPECNDTQAGLKGFRADAARFLFSQMTITGFSFDIEMLYIAHRAGMSIREIPVHFQYREELSTVDFMADGMQLLKDLWAIRYRSIRGRYRFGCAYRKSPQLIIHADDFGMTDGINTGILSAIEKGAVTSTSVMVNFPSSAHALAMARTHALDIGWHITLTLGNPVCNPDDIPSLVQADGTFYPLRRFIQKLIFRQIKRCDIEKELAAQYARFTGAGIALTHVDGHQHVHVMPVVRDVVRALIAQHRIPFVRVPREWRGGGSARWIARVIIGLFRGSRRRFWRTSGARSVPFYGISLSKRVGKARRWTTLLYRLRDHFAQSQTGTVEIMVHPGIDDIGEDRYGDDFGGGRQDELALLTSAQWHTMIASLGFKLVSFRDLAPAPFIEKTAA